MYKQRNTRIWRKHHLFKHLSNIKVCEDTMNNERHVPKLRQPIITVCGHVDHGKTSILDCFRGSLLQAGEAGGITQRISFTKYPLEQIRLACPLIEKQNIRLDIPGFLFIDTPGHAAFTNLRKRGGSLADLAIVVVSIKEGIKPQTAEVLQILRAHKTPFLIALNKIDSISGWHSNKSLKESIEQQSATAREEFDTALLTFQSSLQEHGFDSDLYYEVADFTKKVAIVPCSARTKEGISELLFTLCGLCQRFLKERLKTSNVAKGVILELKKEKGIEWAEAILYDGSLDENDELIIASLAEPIISKVRSLAEILPLSTKYKAVKNVVAAAGVRIQLTNREGVLPGMPFQEVQNNLEEIKVQFKKDITRTVGVDKQGIIVKADSLGSLEALITLLRQENIHILRAGIGPINKADISAAKANLSIYPLDALIAGFNVNLDEDAENLATVKVIINEIVYKLIEEIILWRKEQADQLMKEKMLDLATICKLEILPQHIFRNSNPAIFGVRVLAGKAKIGLPLIDENGEPVAHIKSLQHEKSSVEKAVMGEELAVALPGVAFDRRLKDKKYLYADLSETQFKQFKKNKDLFSAAELKVLQEILDMKQRKKDKWGA